MYPHRLVKFPVVKDDAVVGGNDGGGDDDVEVCKIHSHTLSLSVVGRVAAKVVLDNAAAAAVGDRIVAAETLIVLARTDVAPMVVVDRKNHGRRVDRGRAEVNVVASLLNYCLVDTRQMLPLLLIQLMLQNEVYPRLMVP